MANARAVAGRIQGAVDDYRARNGIDSQTAFYKQLKKKKQSKLAAALRGWLPPPRKWEWNRERQEWTPRPDARGKNPTLSRQAADWEAVRTPRADLLRDFCEYTGASADYVLGLTDVHFPPRQTRSKGVLEADVATHVTREVIEQVRGAPMWQSFVTYWRVDGAAVLRIAVMFALDSFRQATSQLDEFKAQARTLLEDDVSLPNRAGIWLEGPFPGEDREKRLERNRQHRREVGLLVSKLSTVYQQAEFARRINQSESSALVYVPPVSEPATRTKT